MSDEDPSGASGSIQPIGFLVALSDDWRVSRVSANIGDFLDVVPVELPGLPVTSLFSANAIHSLRNRLALLRGPDATERLFSIPLTDSNAHFDVAIHMSGNQAMIEVEPNQHHHHDRESTGTVRGMIAQLGEVDGLAEFFAEAARQVRALTGYDRVTIHRFGEDGTAEVAGEVLRSGIGSAMGRHLPVRTDENGRVAPRSIIRMVADVDAEPVPIIGSPDGRGHDTDLSRIVLSAPSQADLDLLRGIGVSAALSIAIMIEGRTWGLIACHHRAPCCPSFERRSAVEWYAIMLAMQIEVRELKARLS